MNYDFKSSIWHGVYESFKEAGGDMSVFEDDIWLDKMSEKALKAVEAHKRREIISANASTSDYVLVPVAAALAEAGKTLRILDFGGGMAASFYPLVDALETDARIEFHIVENPTLCRRAQEILPQDARLFFHETLPHAGENFDIVHAGSSLHYVEDWKGMLGHLSAYGASLMIFAELTAGEIKETFVTSQHYYGRWIPVWFFRIGDVIQAARENGYTLAYKTRYLGQYCGRFEPPPMESLPETHRMDGFCQLLFKREQKVPQ